MKRTLFSKCVDILSNKLVKRKQLLVKVFEFTFIEISRYIVPTNPTIYIRYSGNIITRGKREKVAIFYSI